MRSVIPIVAFGLLALSAGIANAGCDPPCDDGEICRYEAAGDKHYCAPPPKSGLVPGKGTGTGIVREPGGVGNGNAPALTKTAPGN
ncbi:hypothetical protein P1J78_08465 [Psychromarinibacter sp. C21-152]|uniref:Uncharacterized protein n=1 Tax=Psychromarinibacter sediminicola TaxID=3033385 RepID=A0AAE3NRK3_9RHOB|nr:hypothetical protein [Psychromarinibacter sediminicola]MDF0600761.1 hypothetical protein [Psychromarinibacter sediminicola]